MNFTFHNDDDDHDQNDVYKMFLHYYYHCIIITIIHCCHWICHHSGHIVYMNDGVLMVISTKKISRKKLLFFLFSCYTFEILIKGWQNNDYTQYFFFRLTFTNRIQKNNHNWLDFFLSKKDQSDNRFFLVVVFFYWSIQFWMIIMFIIS